MLPSSDIHRKYIFSIESTILILFVLSFVLSKYCKHLYAYHGLFWPWRSIDNRAIAPGATRRSEMQEATKWRQSGRKWSLLEYSGDAWACDTTALKCSIHGNNKSRWKRYLRRREKARARVEDSFLWLRESQCNFISCELRKWRFQRATALPFS